jgi:hypothetical protein
MLYESGRGQRPPHFNSLRENASMTALTHPGWGAARIIETPG